MEQPVPGRRAASTSRRREEPPGNRFTTAVTASAQHRYRQQGERRHETAADHRIPLAVKHEIDPRGGHGRAATLAEGCRTHRLGTSTGRSQDANPRSRPRDARSLPGGRPFEGLDGSRGALAVAGGDEGRRAAAYGLACVGLTSAVVNMLVKPLSRRRRPDRVGRACRGARHVPMPVSTSFPSGHSAAAFAFATGVGHVMPRAAVPLRALAAVVAYSRVHTGVHYPGDAVVGSLIGTAIAQITSRELEERVGRG